MNSTNPWQKRQRNSNKKDVIMDEIYELIHITQQALTISGFRRLGKYPSIHKERIISTTKPKITKEQ